MQSESQSENTPITGTQKSGFTTGKSFSGSDSLRRTRVAALVFLSFKLLLSLVFFVIQLTFLILRFTHGLVYVNFVVGRISDTVIGGVAFIFTIIFIILVAKSSRVGVLVFACLGLIELLSLLVVVGYSIWSLVLIVRAELGAVLIGVSSTLLGISALMAIFSIIIVALSFKLAKLIKMQENYQLI